MSFGDGGFGCAGFFGLIILTLVIVFGYLFFEPFITEETITFEVINKAQFGNEDSKYFIFSKDEVFVNTNNSYQNKTNADEIYEKIYVGNKIKVVVVGVYIPWFSRFRNITKLLEINDVPVDLL
jgi:hypothetical protein